MTQILRIATRKSPLALWQAEYVRDRLVAAHPGLRVEQEKMSTQGDKILDSPLAKIGGKGLFVKELEDGLLSGRADIAVHSMKDVPVELPGGLHLPVICKREDPRDAFISNDYPNLDALPQSARVGTSSLRRQCQIMARRPDLTILSLRGNVNTRLAKLAAGDFDPVINRLIAVLDDPDTHTRVAAERAMNHRLEGGCQVPIAGHATLDGETLHLRGLVGAPDGSKMIRGEICGPRGDAERLGVALADELLAQGAAAILKAVYASGR